MGDVVGVSAFIVQGRSQTDRLPEGALEHVVEDVLGHVVQNVVALSG